MKLRTVATTVLAGLALLATPANAKPTKPVKHCVASVQGGAMTCYGDFKTAISKATNGKVTDAPASASAAAKDATFESKLNSAAARTSAVAASSIVIGIEYADDDYEGSSLIYSAPYGCDADTSTADWVAWELPSDWNDEIESFRTYAGCAAMHYMHFHQIGPMEGYWYSWGDLYWLNDEVSSIDWS